MNDYLKIFTKFRILWVTLLLFDVMLFDTSLLVAKMVGALSLKTATCSLTCHYFSMRLFIHLNFSLLGNILLICLNFFGWSDYFGLWIFGSKFTWNWFLVYLSLLALKFWSWGSRFEIDWLLMIICVWILINVMKTGWMIHTFMINSG